MLRCENCDAFVDIAEKVDEEISKVRMRMAVKSHEMVVLERHIAESKRQCTTLSLNNDYLRNEIEIQSNTIDGLRRDVAELRAAKGTGGGPPVPERLHVDVDAEKMKDRANRAERKHAETAKAETQRTTKLRKIVKKLSRPVYDLSAF